MSEILVHSNQYNFTIHKLLDPLSRLLSTLLLINNIDAYITFSCGTHIISTYPSTLNTLHCADAPLDSFVIVPKVVLLVFTMDDLYKAKRSNALNENVRFDVMLEMYPEYDIQDEEEDIVNVLASDVFTHARTVTIGGKQFLRWKVRLY